MTWTVDGTAFMRDQAGSRDGMYYRQFRCKGKGKGKCSQSYTHEDFLALAIRQLGTERIDRIKGRCGFTLPNPTPAPKRPHDGQATGYTPASKRIGFTTMNRNITPPSFVLPTPTAYSKVPDRRDMSFADCSVSQIVDSQENDSTVSDPQLDAFTASPNLPDSRGIELVHHFCILSNFQSIRLQRAEMLLEVLTSRLEQKEEHISILKEKVKLLTDVHGSSTASPSFAPSNPFTVEQSHDSGTPVDTPDPLFTPIPLMDSLNVNDDEVVPSTYAEVAQSPPTVSPVLLRRIPSPVEPPNPHKKLQQKHQLTVIYFLGLSQNKIGGFRKHARQLGLSLQPIQNISFIGASIVELLVDLSIAQSFIDQAKSLGFKVRVDLDIVSKSNHNPVVMEYAHLGSSISDAVKSNFVRRVSHEIKTSTNERVRQYYLEWAQMLNWKESLLLSSTSSGSQ